MPPTDQTEKLPSKSPIHFSHFHLVLTETQDIRRTNLYYGICLRISFKLTLYINSASTRQYHHVGWRAGWSWGFNSNSNSSGPSCWNVGAGACGASEWVTDNNCRRRKWTSHSLKNTHIQNKLMLKHLLCFQFLLALEGRHSDWLWHWPQH